VRAPAELSPRRRLLVLATCCASIVVVVMDISIGNVALPAIRRDLDASVSGLQWTIDAYTLVLWALPATLGTYLLFGIFLGTVNPPITNTAVAGMPRSIVGAARGVWWTVLGLGLRIAALGLLSTTRRASDSAMRAAALFDAVDQVGVPRTVPQGRSSGR
jgi:hypothetical protein